MVLLVPSPCVFVPHCIFSALLYRCCTRMCTVHTQQNRPSYGTHVGSGKTRLHYKLKDIFCNFSYSHVSFLTCRNGISIHMHHFTAVKCCTVYIYISKWLIDPNEARVHTEQYVSSECSTSKETINPSFTHCNSSHW